MRLMFSFDQIISKNLKEEKRKEGQPEPVAINATHGLVISGPLSEQTLLSLLPIISTRNTRFSIMLRSQPTVFTNACHDQTVDCCVFM